MKYVIKRHFVSFKEKIEAFLSNFRYLDLLGYQITDKTLKYLFHTFAAPIKPMMDKNIDILPEMIIIYADDMYKLFRNSTSMNDLSIKVQTPIAKMAIPPTYFNT